MEEREVDDQHRQENVNAAVNILNSDINNRVHDINPAQQEDVDSIIMYVYNFLSINTSAKITTEVDSVNKT